MCGSAATIRHRKVPTLAEGAAKATRLEPKRLALGSTVIAILRGGVPVATVVLSEISPWRPLTKQLLALRPTPATIAGDVPRAGGNGDRRVTFHADADLGRWAVVDQLHLAATDETRGNDLAKVWRVGRHKARVEAINRPSTPDD